MNAISPVRRSLAPFEARFRGAEGSDRKSAVGALERSGLPTQHVEAWHYTGLKLLSGRIFSEAAAAVDVEAARETLSRLLREHDMLASLPRLVFVNGSFAPELSSDRVPEGVSVTSFCQKEDFGIVASPEREAMVALNTALATDGLVLSVKAGVDAGKMVLISLSIGENKDISLHLRHDVTLEDGARLSLVEIYAGSENASGYLQNPVLTCVVGKGAELTHIKLQNDAEQAIHLATVYADVAIRGLYESFTLMLGAELSRHEVHAAMRGDHGAVHVNGAQILAGQQVGDITSVITHGAPDCVSRQTVRNVLTDRSRGVFQGKVLVERVAQKTDGYQMNQALLLSPTAEIDAKPELEIYADDVKCSHGATVGALDEDQLFYLRARGVPEAQARQMLVEAFLVETVDLVADETLHSFLEQTLSRSLRRTLAARVSASGQSA